MLIFYISIFLYLKSYLDLPTKIIAESTVSYEQVNKMYETREDQNKIQKTRHAAEKEINQKFGFYTVHYIFVVLNPFIAICCYYYAYHNELKVDYISKDMFYETLIISLYLPFYVFDLLLMLIGHNIPGPKFIVVFFEKA